MQDWTQGYHAQTAYPDRFYRELAPSFLDYVALSQGMHPPRREQNPFRYAELGCANGFTLNALAASHPQGEFVGIDFMPQHIAKARQQAAEVGLANVQFFEMSFAEALAPNYHQAWWKNGGFDYIVLHGVWSWVSEEHRQEALTFIRQFLKPGGLVYISYNTHPGWDDKLWVREVLRFAAQKHPFGVEGQFHQGLQDLQKILSAKPQGLTAAAQAHIESLKDKPANYIAQEYLNAQWQIFYAHQVHESLSQVKCQYIGSATLKDNLLSERLTLAQEQVLQSEPHPQRAQTLLDILTHQSFRRDVFVKGAQPLDPQSLRPLWQEQTFVLTQPLSTKLEVIDELADFWHGLSEKPQSLPNLQHLPPRSLQKIFQAIQRLVANNHITPVNSQKAPTADVLAFNRHLSKNAQNANQPKVLLSHWGNGLPVTVVEQLLYASYHAQQVKWQDFSQHLIPFAPLEVDGQVFFQLQEQENAVQHWIEQQSQKIFSWWRASGLV